MTADTKRSSSTAADAQLLYKLPKIAGALALVLIVGYAAVFHALPFDQNPGAWGSFGDFMGGLLNPLISLFTLIVAVSVWKLQKTELEEMRSAVREQGKTAEQQRREQRFFDFLNLYQQTLATVDADGKYGKTAFRHWCSANAIQFAFIYDFMRHGFEPHQQSGPRPTSVEEAAQRLLNPTYVTFTETDLTRRWDSFSPILDHYFRTVFAILREAQPTLKEDHFRYVKLFRAQLSRDELALLAFNLLLDHEGSKMRNLVQKYGLLKHLPAGHLRTFAESRLSPDIFGQKWVLMLSANPGKHHAD